MASLAAQQQSKQAFDAMNGAVGGIRTTHTGVSNKKQYAGLTKQKCALATLVGRA
jgi:hypothetical protein